MLLMDTERFATLTIDGKNIELPVLTGTHGNDVIDIRSLFAKTGYFTFDSGFMSTASCDSAITYVDGDNGVLLYRGYPIEQLAEHYTFLDVAYLLKHGELPNEKEKADFEHIIKTHTMVNEQMVKLYQGFRRDAHPMAVMVGVVGALSAFYNEADDFSDAAHRNISFNRIVAKLPTIVAMAHKYSLGEPFMYPRNDLDYSANFMHMMFGNPCERYEPNPVLVHALDTIFTLHADHEQNASTSTVRLAGSSLANPYACISAGIGCLWGPAHGGANEACLKMLEEIGDVSRVPEYIKRAKDKNDSFKLMGFGHRVYKNFDPRAKIMRQVVRGCSSGTGAGERSPVQAGQRTGKDRAGRRLLRREEALSERRLLLRYRAEGHRHPDLDVYLHLCPGAHGRLDGAVGGNDHRSTSENRSPASTLCRYRPPRCAGNQGVSLPVKKCFQQNASHIKFVLSLAGACCFSSAVSSPNNGFESSMVADAMG